MSQKYFSTHHQRYITLMFYSVVKQYICNPPRNILMHMIQNIHGVGHQVQYSTEVYKRFHVVHKVTYVWRGFIAGKPFNSHNCNYGSLLEQIRIIQNKNCVIFFLFLNLNLNTTKNNSSLGLSTKEEKTASCGELGRLSVCPFTTSVGD